MNKNNLKRCKAGIITAMMLSSGTFLVGCKDRGFELTLNEERNFVAEDYSYVNNEFIEKCYVVEAKSHLTNKSNIYIAYKKTAWNLPNSVKNYYDVFTNVELFTSDNQYNDSFEVKKETRLIEYVVSLNLIKGSYSYEDIEKLYDEIKKIYVYEEAKVLVK